MRKVYHKIIHIAGNVITVEAEGVGYNELAEVTSARGVSLAQVIRLADGKVSLQVFAGSRGISTDDQVRFLGREMQVSSSDALLGRVFTGRGTPRDGKPDVASEMVEIGGPSVNPSKRIIPRNMIRTNIPMIDVFNTLVESQKLPIFSIAGEPYNELLARIALQAEVDVIILGGMGLKHDDYLKFKNTLDEQGALSRTVMFIHTASDPIVECLMVPDMALAVAEQYALEGKRVLALLTDMTNFADALKEIAITMEQIPATRGYPGDLYSQLASRYEKAVDFDSAGSITILAVTTMTENIVDLVKSGAHLGSVDSQWRKDRKVALNGGKERYYSFPLSCHDNTSPRPTANLIEFAYQSLFSPFIPLWLLGEEWSNPLTVTGWSWPNPVRWELLEQEPGKAFYETIKRMIRIRRQYPEIFEYFPPDHRDSNLCKVQTNHPKLLQAYARYQAGKAILIVPNNGENTEKFRITIPYSDLGIKSTPVTITDLLGEKQLASGHPETFDTTIPPGMLGIYLVCPEK